MATFDQHVTQKPISARAGTAVSMAGAAVSLALIAGVSVWGYKLIVRDVSGIPVVRAMDGAMRIAPEQPGGNVALHAGLTVNEVAAVGQAAGLEDVLLLAPATTQLSEEDLAVQQTAEANEVIAVDTVVVADAEVPTALETDPPEATGPLSTDDILALADQIAAGAAPLTDLAAGENVAPQVTLDGAAVTATFVPEIATSVPGVSVSLRPTVRPATLVTVVAAPQTDAALQTATPQTEAAEVLAAVVAATPAPISESAAILTAAVPVGTTLVQLGAFPTAEQAATEWSRLSGRFAQYLNTKNQVIQEATSGGQTFYRLRASGFDDTGDARRFCAALVAGNADCIPVVSQ